MERAPGPVAAARWAAGPLRLDLEAHGFRLVSGPAPDLAADIGRLAWGDRPSSVR